MPKIKLHQRTREFACPRPESKTFNDEGRGLMLGVLQSHFKVAGGRLVVKSKGVGFRSFHGTFGLILIYAAREHSNPVSARFALIFNNIAGAPASAA